MELFATAESGIVFIVILATGLRVRLSNPRCWWGRQWSTLNVGIVRVLQKDKIKLG